MRMFDPVDPVPTPERFVYGPPPPSEPGVLTVSPLGTPVDPWDGPDNAQGKFTIGAFTTDGRYGAIRGDASPEDPFQELEITLHS